MGLDVSFSVVRKGSDRVYSTSDNIRNWSYLLTSSLLGRDLEGSENVFDHYMSVESFKAFAQKVWSLQHRVRDPRYVDCRHYTNGCEVLPFHRWVMVPNPEFMSDIVDLFPALAAGAESGYRIQDFEGFIHELDSVCDQVRVQLDRLDNEAHWEESDIYGEDIEQTYQVCFAGWR